MVDSRFHTIEDTLAHSRECFLQHYSFNFALMNRATFRFQ